MPVLALTLLLIASPQGIRSSAKPSTAKPLTSNPVTSKSGIRMNLPKGWLTVDTKSKKFQDAVKASPLKRDLDFYKRVEPIFDLMALDMFSTESFVDNVNVLPRKLKQAIRTDNDFENLYRQIAADSSRKNMNKALIKLKCGPALCYWGSFVGPRGARNDTVSYLLPQGAHSLVFTFSTAPGNGPYFRPLTERVMQSVVLK